MDEAERSRRLTPQESEPDTLEQELGARAPASLASPAPGLNLDEAFEGGFVVSPANATSLPAWKLHGDIFRLYYLLYGLARRGDASTAPRGTTVRRGELVTSLSQLAEMLTREGNPKLGEPAEYTPHRDTVRRWLRTLERRDIIVMKSDRYIGTWIKIVGFEALMDTKSYRGSRQQTAQRSRQGYDSDSPTPKRGDAEEPAEVTTADGAEVTTGLRQGYDSLTTVTTNTTIKEGEANSPSPPGPAHVKTAARTRKRVARPEDHLVNPMRDLLFRMHHDLAGLDEPPDASRALGFCRTAARWIRKQGIFAGMTDDQILARLEQGIRGRYEAQGRVQPIRYLGSDIGDLMIKYAVQSRPSPAYHGRPGDPLPMTPRRES